ncbi:KIAA2012 -like protein, partial [Chelydra serpentina]
MPNLSLLSRGTGQVVKKTHEKLEVHFEPEDYLNWKYHEGYCHVSRLLNERQFMKGCWGLYLPKTYSTKTGALVLYSEDLAEPSWKQRGGRSGQQGLRHRRNKLQIELHTLQDLTRAILAYGGRQKYQKGTAWQPHLHFLKKPDNQIDRQIRPGYSAKRYLFRLSQTWDPSIIYRLQCAGYIRDPLLLQENSLNTPNHRIGQQDLSAVPQKYHLLPVFPSFWAELSQQIHPGQSYSFQKEAENRENLVEGDEVETHGRRRARAPVRVSVRRLSLELRPPPAKEATWSQNAACTKVPQGTKVEDHQDVERAMEGQWHGERPHQKDSQEHREKLNQTVKSSLGNATMDTSQLLSERSYMTFYGGYFPGRKKPYSGKKY